MADDGESAPGVLELTNDSGNLGMWEITYTRWTHDQSGRLEYEEEKIK